MKKIAALFVLAFSGGVVVAQDLIAEPQKSNVYPINNDHGHTPNVVGGTQTDDTLFYFEGYSFYVSNPNDAAAFSYQNTGNYDVVASALSNSAFAPSSPFVFFYALDANYDTVNYIGATSWYSPIGTANNWFTFGPITIPTSGATLQWLHAMPNNNYRDGYEVKLSTTGLAPSNFSSSPNIFEVSDKSFATINDTDFVSRHAVISSAYNGQQVYVAFHHDAHDCFILYLDEILLTEGAMGLEEQDGTVAIGHSMPNPASAQVSINYTLKSYEPVSISVYDVTGKEVMRLDEGNKMQGAHSAKIDVSSMSEGIYYYTVNAGGFKAAQKLVVSR